MNHGKSKRKFGRIRKVRKSLLNSLVLALILKNKIKTTEAKARSLRPYVEKIITQGRLGTLAGRRNLVSKIGKIGAEKIVKDIAPRYEKSFGGYTRITKLPARLSDGALMAVIELI
ncbi:MAG: 50S ribosomal protein L17 [Candidatus Zambryskibacteria bacterium]|nr:50S ribosomal protein L17 [Candidatus Zambryskibacteria bacterium]